MKVRENTNKLKMLFEMVSRKYTRSEAFYDMVTIMAIALSNSVDKEQWEKREAEYYRIEKKYDKPTMEIFTKFLAQLTLALNKQPSDYLGLVFMECGFNDQKQGQVYTPHHIAELMARMTMGSVEGLNAQKNERGRIGVMDICCGGGQLLIGHYNALISLKQNPTEIMEVFAKDISDLAAKMSYVQLFLLGVPGIVVQGNGLLPDDVIQEWYLPYHTTLSSWDLPKEKIRESQQYEQLILF